MFVLGLVLGVGAALSFGGRMQQAEYEKVLHQLSNCESKLFDCQRENELLRILLKNAAVSMEFDDEDGEAEYYERPRDERGRFI
jgi:hypothetical protein